MIRFFITAIASLPLVADAPPRWGHWTAWGDQQDGSYRNPVLPADFSDLDAIRVGADYYAISSTLHLSPGMAVLHSRDLVNWRMIGHVVPDLTVLGPEYRWNRLARYGRGVWAGTIRHHAGRFHVFFGTPDEGFFTASAINPAGPWTAPHTLLRGPGWDDCSVLWDDYGQAYFIGTNFANGYKSYIFRMAADGRSIDRDSAVLVNEGSGREASKLLKVGRWYYIIYSEHKGAGRYVMAKRARRPMGPYGEGRQVAQVGREAHEPNQGGIVQAPDGRWHFLTHHGSQDWEGRAASLLPVTWIDGWPIIGAVQPDGLGAMIWSAPMPIPGAASPSIQTDDDFSSATLSPQWEWNHQPRADRWSLSERPGWLRLHAWQPLKAGDLRTAGNVVSQRSLRTPANAFTAKLDLRGMADGQRAGLAHVSADYAGLGVVQKGNGRTIEFITPTGTTPGPALRADTLWLRSEWGSDGQARFAYSTDGRRFVPLGAPYTMRRANYRGDRISLYSFNDLADRGHVDIDDVRYRYTSLASQSPSGR